MVPLVSTWVYSKTDCSGIFVGSYYNLNIKSKGTTERPYKTWQKNDFRGSGILDFYKGRYHWL